MKSIWKINMKSMWHQCFLVTWMKGASIIQSSTEQHTLLRMRKRQKKEYKMMNGFLGPFVEDRTHTWRFLLGASINNVDIILGDFWPTPGPPPLHWQVYRISLFIIVEILEILHPPLLINVVYGWPLAWLD